MGGLHSPGMPQPSLWVANDHAAYPLKTHLIQIADQAGWAVQDLGLSEGSAAITLIVPTDWLKT